MEFKLRSLTAGLVKGVIKECGPYVQEIVAEDA